MRLARNIFIRQPLGDLCRDVADLSTKGEWHRLPRSGFIHRLSSEPAGHPHLRSYPGGPQKSGSLNFLHVRFHIRLQSLHDSRDLDTLPLTHAFVLFSVLATAYKIMELCDQLARIRHRNYHRHRKKLSVLLWEQSP